MNRTTHMNQIKMNEMLTWEDCFTIVVEGIKQHGQKVYNRAIKIMKAIDAQLTELILSESTQEESNDEVTYTVYHGTHEDIEQFMNREVKTYDSIGTWFTDQQSHARMLYGKKVYESQIKLYNPLIINGVVDTKTFDEFFYNQTIAAKYMTNPTIDNINNLLLNKNYISEFKQDLIDKGYDGIVFADSRIDLAPEDNNHTVYIVFNANNIKVLGSKEMN